MNESSFWSELWQLISHHATSQRRHWQQPLLYLGRQLVPNLGTVLVVVLLLWANSAGAAPWNAPAAPTWPSATTINYQGRLADSGGTPIDGTVGMDFSFYDSDAGGSLLWGPESHTGVPVSDGLFSVQLGSKTGGGIPTSVLAGDIWLEITVDGETLSPRERLGAVPYAMQALTVPDGAITQTQAPSLIGGQTENAQLRWGYAIFDTDANGEAVINLSNPFPNGIGAVIAENADYNVGGFTVHYRAGGSDWTPGSFRVRLYGVNGSRFANRHVQIRYIAVGN